MAITDKKTGLNSKQKLFCQLYIECFNSTKSYQTAYGTDDYQKAKTLANRLLKNVYVKDYIKKLQDEAREAMNITPEFLIQKALNIYEMATKAKPVLRFNPETKKMEECGEYMFDAKGANGALDIIASVTGLKLNKIDAKLSLEKVTIKDDI